MGPPTIPLSGFMRNTVFFKSQNPRKAGTLCTLIRLVKVHANQMRKFDQIFNIVIEKSVALNPKGEYIGLLRLPYL